MKRWRQEYWSRVTKGEKSTLKGGWEKAINGKQMDSVQEESEAVSATGVIVDKKHNLAPKTQTQADGRRPSKGFGPKRQRPS